MVDQSSFVVSPVERIASLTSLSRSASVVGFQEVGGNVALYNMRRELDKLVENVSDQEAQEIFRSELDGFYQLFQRYLVDRAKLRELDWDKIRSPSGEMIVPYSKLPSTEVEENLLDKLAVLKLNGGLGTTMGCVGPKSVIEVRDGMSFLDLTVRQIEYLNEQNNVAVPLILMNSFNTDEETNKVVRTYTGHNVNVLTFNQSRYPRILKESHLPKPAKYDDDIQNWYPPGHGDLFQSLHRSGLLDALLAQGKEYLFISNIDNLGATVDMKILNYMAESGSEFIMEVTDKTKADIKGGTLIDYDGHIRLLEIAQVPPEHVEDFKSVKKFKIFNTNNLWVSLKAIKRVLDEESLELEIIVNPKTLPSGEQVIQLETAVGAAIKHFRGAQGINVPRSRFLPVKSTSDLFLITSDLYHLNHGELIMNSKRMFQTTPLIKLGDHFKKVREFLSRFQGCPHILDLDHLTVTGDVSFGKNVELRGTVIIVANHGCRIDIPSGAVLEDKVVSGNLRILDH